MEAMEGLAKLAKPVMAREPDTEDLGPQRLQAWLKGECEPRQRTERLSDPVPGAGEANVWDMTDRAMVPVATKGRHER
jgi:hypothetical protein